MYMLNALGDSTAPSLTPRTSLKVLPTRLPMQTIVLVTSRMASMRRHSPSPTPHWNIFLMRMGLLREGKAVRRSTHRTNRRLLCIVLESTSARRSATASLHPVLLRNPNCALPGCQAARALLSKILPNQEAILLVSLMPRKLEAALFGLPGFSRARNRDVPQTTGYTA